MGVKPETLFGRRFNNWWKKFGLRGWFFKTQEVGVRGIPDKIICAWQPVCPTCGSTSQFLSAEMKIHGGILDPLQQHRLDSINRAGGIAREVDPSNFKEFLLMVKNINEGGRRCRNTKGGGTY